MKFLRALLILGRVSNLPTVWSNCLAGWLLGGGGGYEKLPLLFAGATFLYTGGMFLNDAFDVEFDREHRAERPIPSRAISAGAVWAWGFGWLFAGIVCLFWLGSRTGVTGLVLFACILIYDWIHKRTILAPVLMGVCRTVLYLVAAATAAEGVTGWAVWGGLVMGAYVIGLSYLARGESQKSVEPNESGVLRYWPLLFLANPVVLALVANANGYRNGALLISAIVLLWVAKSLRYTLWTPQRNVGRAVSGLLAGIVLVDWLAVCYAPKDWGFIFIGLFLSALMFQRFIPAT